MAQTQLSNDIFDRPYLLLTPGPLSTTPTVRQAMGRDWCTWDADYNEGVVSDVRRRVELLASPSRPDAVTSTLIQGSGTAAVEATVGSSVPTDGHLLVLANGHYGQRIGRIAEILGIRSTDYDVGELGRFDPAVLRSISVGDSTITHMAVVRCWTSTGLLNDIAPIIEIAKAADLTVIVDAMSSFGGLPFDMIELGIDFLVTSANKCIQGVPGVGIVVALRGAMEACEGRARSLSLDLFDQWSTMEAQHGKWRFTSPTHVVRALHQALIELDAEGGPEARLRRYGENHRLLVEGMSQLGFRMVLNAADASPFITSFYLPDDVSFDALYRSLKADGFVIYPGKVTDIRSFRIGTIGDVFPSDIQRLLHSIHRFQKDET